VAQGEQPRAGPCATLARRCRGRLKRFKGGRKALKINSPAQAEIGGEGQPRQHEFPAPGQRCKAVKAACGPSNGPPRCHQQQASSIDSMGEHGREGEGARAEGSPPSVKVWNPQASASAFAAYAHSCSRAADRQRSALRRRGFRLMNRCPCSTRKRAKTRDSSLGPWPQIRSLRPQRLAVRIAHSDQSLTMG